MNNNNDVRIDKDLSEIDLDTLEEDFFTPEELAQRWKTSEGYLANRRYQNRRPAYIKVGSKVLYPVDEIIEYEEKNRRPTSPEDGGLPGDDTKADLRDGE